MTTTQEIRGTEANSWAELPAFIETQFPVSKLSKESYKERKAVAGQTLTALGKWWGRKPLVLVRAAILGLLLPSTDDPTRDREIFLALMAMDDDGLLQRIDGPISAPVVHEHCTASERRENFDAISGKIKWKNSVASGTKHHLQELAFRRMSYDDKLKYCLRPEETPGPQPDSWRRINSHLATNASSLDQLVSELGERRFGRVPRVADPFCGGGSIPFEAARIGCDAYGSDLSPIAALLTWGALNIVGGDKQAKASAEAAQRRAYDAARRQVDDWQIERNERGWVADAYLYCNEVVDPGTGWRVPLAGSWLIAEKPNVVAQLVPDLASKSFSIEIMEGVSAKDADIARADGTWSDGVRCPIDSDGNLLPQSMRKITPFAELKGPTGLRRWESQDILPLPGDVFQERLYCIRWVDPATGIRHYEAPTAADEEREKRVVALLTERIPTWQASGFMPRAPVVPGADNNRPARARGWTHWHHFFNPRQLLLNGLIAEAAANETDRLEAVAALLAVGRTIDFNARLCRWQTGQGGGIGGGKTVFYSPSLNTPFPNFSCRTMTTLESVVCMPLKSRELTARSYVELLDARQVNESADIWITDPGYADMVNYEELSEFFLAWYEQRLPQLFPGWYADSKRALAVAGKDEDFRKAMVECYRRFAGLMPENGLQVVMFTHQSAEVWSDLALILWAAGLRVSQAWTIATETGSTGVKQGNYVQGTVLLVLRKRLVEKRGDMADIYPDLQAEVQRQMQLMLDLDPKDDPNFGDSDYQLAAYAAALRVLTEYSSIDEIDVERELHRTRGKGERSPLTGIIEHAVKIASDYLVPDGLDRPAWRKLSPEERLYMKGLDVEAHGEYREGVYQEFARGFGVGEYRWLLGNSEANKARLKTPSEFKGRDLVGQGFAGSLVRKLLYAIWVTASNEDVDPRPARTYLKQELPDYWDQRPMIMELLRYLAEKPRVAAPSRTAEEQAHQHGPMAHWSKDAQAARLLLGSVENDSV